MARNADNARRLRQFALDVALPPLFVAATIFVPRLPRPCIVALAWLAGVLGEALCRGHMRKVAHANLRVALGDELAPRKRREILRGSFANSALVLLDMFWFSRDTDRRIARHVEYGDNPSQVASLAPIIGVTAHFGNWELLARACSLHLGPMTCPVAAIPHPGAQEMIEGLRRDAKLQFVPRAGSARLLLASLRAGNSVGLVMDQNTPLGRGGEFVKLFGLPVAASTSAAVLARLTGRPILPTFCAPIGNGRYRMYALPPVFVPEDPLADRATVDARVTQEILKAFEEQIRQRPELWFWTYHRWKFIPFGTGKKSRHPFYADSVIFPREFARAKSLTGGRTSVASRS